MSKETTKVKLKYLLDACNDPTVTDCEFRHLFALLIQFHNGETLKCFPTDEALGRAAGGKCARTAGAQSRRLQEKGFLTKTQSGRGAADYVILARQNVAEREDNDRQDFADRARQDAAVRGQSRSATSCRAVGNIVSSGRQDSVERSATGLPTITIEETIEETIEGTIEEREGDTRQDVADQKNGQQEKPPKRDPHTGLDLDKAKRDYEEAAKRSREERDRELGIIRRPRP